MLSIMIHLHCLVRTEIFHVQLLSVTKTHFEAFQVFTKVRIETSVRVLVRVETLVLSQPIFMAENYETYFWQFKFTEFRFRNIRRSLDGTLLHEVASTRRAHSFPRTET